MFICVNECVYFSLHFFKFYFNHQKVLTNVKLVSQIYVMLVFFIQQIANRSK